MIKHPFPPLYDGNSKILILGSFPSVKSREQLFFYGHPQNRFWKVTSAVFGVKTPATVREKTDFLLSHNIALWDVIASCNIRGSSDSSISDAAPNDLSPILEGSQVKRIFTNGKTADKFYRKYTYPATGIQASCLLSTSPANAAWSLERLIEEWSVIRHE